LDLIFKEAEPNTYNILLITGSSLRYLHTAKVLAKLSKAKSGENHPRNFLGKRHLIETITKMSLANLGENNAMSKKVFIYSFDLETKENILYKSFNSCIEAAKYFNYSTRTLSNYLDKKKLYKKQ
jgi:group I intron endonuclease